LDSLLRDIDELTAPDADEATKDFSEKSRKKPRSNSPNPMTLKIPTHKPAPQFSPKQESTTIEDGTFLAQRAQVRNPFNPPKELPFSFLEESQTFIPQPTVPEKKISALSSFRSDSTSLKPFQPRKEFS